MTGYVLAGGRSSRMGRDKALLELAGKPLIQRAVETMAPFCDEVAILSSTPALAAYGRLVPDLHPGCGPLGGIESGLRENCSTWNIFLAVDMPFVIAASLREWIAAMTCSETARIALFTVEGVPQPTLCLLHREVAPLIEAAIARGELSVIRVLEEAAITLAARLGISREQVMVVREAAEADWFLNLNTPEEFAAAAARLQSGNCIQ